jgi:hypothetical protein
LKSLTVYSSYGSTTLTLRDTTNISATHASPSCTLEQVVFIDCWNVSLEFMATLARLKSVSFVRKDLTVGPLPESIPPSAYARIERLELRLDRLCTRQNFNETAHTVSMEDFPSLRWLLLESTLYPLHPGSTDFLVWTMSLLLRLETLKLLGHAPKMARPPTVTSFEIDHEHWDDYDHGSPTLRELVINNYCSNRRLDLRSVSRQASGFAALLGTGRTGAEP